MDQPILTPSQFWDRCERHDWYYAMSDDPRAYRAGDAERKRLLAEAARDPNARLLPIYEAWLDHVFSGPAYGMQRGPRPERPAE